MGKVDAAAVVILKALFDRGDTLLEVSFADVMDAIADAAEDHDHTPTGGPGSGTGDASPVTNLHSGIAANKPAAPAVGDIYIETDTGKLYACFTAENWSDLTPTADMLKSVYDSNDDGAVNMAQGLKESGTQQLTMGAVADGQLLKRSGTTIIGDTVMQQMDFWSDMHSAEVEITTSAGDKSFDAACQITPDVPAGATIQKAILMLKFRYVRDSSDSPNAIDVTALTPAVQIQKVTEGSWIDAITIVADMLTCDATTKEGGDVWIGDIDVKAQITDGAPSECQIDDAQADEVNLYIGEIQLGLRVWFT